MNDVKELVKLACGALEEKKAQDITVLDISQVSVIADYFIIASADNERQVSALCDGVDYFSDNYNVSSMFYSYKE